MGRVSGAHTGVLGEGNGGRTPESSGFCLYFPSGCHLQKRSLGENSLSDMLMNRAALCINVILGCFYFMRCRQREGEPTQEAERQKWQSGRGGLGRRGKKAWWAAASGPPGGQQGQHRELRAQASTASPHSGGPGSTTHLSPGLCGPARRVLPFTELTHLDLTKSPAWSATGRTSA